MIDDMKYTVFYTDENGQLVPNGEKLLSITEIAKYRNIPTERLRYYDKIASQAELITERNRGLFQRQKP